MKYVFLIILVILASGCSVRQGSFCSGNITDAASCYLNTFNENNESVCADLKGTAVSGCYYAMALKYNKSSLCASAEDKWKDLCYYTLAVTQNNDALCGEIGNVTMAAECRSS
jgi:hypothetical protein